MNKEQATRLIEKTFNNKFCESTFKEFINELLNSPDFSKERGWARGEQRIHSFKEHIVQYKRLCQYTDTEDNKADVLIIELENGRKLERARTTLRNFAVEYLNRKNEHYYIDTILAAYFSKDSNDWRFSYIKVDYKTQIIKGKVKAVKELTPAKRLSYLVGENENSHTAQKQFFSLLQKTDENPKLTEIAECFSVEKVSNEFFKKYNVLFENLKTQLEKIIKKDEKIKNEFSLKQITIDNFCKKLLGQIVFLYFIQKKGWLGVERDAVWGTGPKNYLRQLFNKKNYKNFFNDVLEHLFYSELAVERTDNFSTRFNTKIPFLNGGLFESDYNWVHTDITIPDWFFSNNEISDEGDIGTGILDVFDLYNFTVKEDEPLDKEVAIDPEMLGKVFENLLDTTERKSKGSFYTPREIVHYMCQESLINYLHTHLEQDCKIEEIEEFVHHSEMYSEFNSTVLQLQQSEQKSTLYGKLNLPQGIIDNAKKVDQLFEMVRVCDPAIGSGAFPVSMMIEIVKLRMILFNAGLIKQKYFIENDEKQERNPYNYKRHCIQNCIYGVDIDPGAIDIAKLRLWLSLVVDEDDIKQIKPLPNLDYKIMQGNSLLEQYEGIKLFDERILKDDKKIRIEKLIERRNILQSEYIELHQSKKLSDIKEKQLNDELKRNKDELELLRKKEKDEIDLFKGEKEARIKTEKLEELHVKFFNSYSNDEKKKLRKQIEELEWDLIETTLKEEGKFDSLKNLDKIKKSKIKPYFLWHLEFAEVFQENRGFDIVISNPPYLSPINLDREEKSFYKNNYQTAVGRFDTYGLFIEKGINLLVDYGQLIYIIPNKFLTNIYFEKLRKYILETCEIKSINFISENAFDHAAVNNIIIGLKKHKDENKNYQNLISIFKSENKSIINDGTIIQGEITSNVNTSFQIHRDIEYNNIYVKIKCKSERFSNIFNVRDGIVAGRIKDVLFSKKKENLHYKKIIFGDNMDKYCISWKGDWVNYDIEKMKNLDKKRGSGGLRMREESIFEPKKIITRKTSDKIIAAFDDIGYHYEQSVHGSVLLNKSYNELFFLGILNSKLYEYYYKKIVNQSGTIFPQVRIDFLKNLPIRIIDFKLISDKLLYNKIVDKVNKIVETKRKQNDITILENKLDLLVYKLYDLTYDEVKIVDPNIEQIKSREEYEND